jgi:two-component system, NtrC family, sensor histidine kinase HydH
MPGSGVAGYVRPQDFVWLLLFSALAVISPERNSIVLGLLVVLGIVQVLEPRIGAIASVVLKLGLCYLLIGYGGGVSSTFYLILLLPVITAATSFGLLGTAIATLAACAEYLSFLLFLDWQSQFIPEDQVRELVLRVLFLLVVGFLTNQLAEANRDEARKAQAAANQLADANRNLQEAEAHVRRTDRLAALGQLTAGLAHELRNPLGTMKTSAEMLRRQVAGDNDIAREMAGYITEEVDRTNSLITRFLEFARPQHLRLVDEDVHAMLDRSIVRFEKESNSRPSGPKPSDEDPRVSVFKNYSPDVPSVRLDGELMERVMVNLLSNAAQASPTGGAITVKTRLAAEQTPAAVEISVIDRGSGIKPEDLENIFNPFFTTKPEGTGLGLAICSKIVNEHGGQINVESTPGEGSIFRVYLPVAQ